MPGDFDDINQLLDDLDLSAEQFADNEEEQQPEAEKKEGEATSELEGLENLDIGTESSAEEPDKQDKIEEPSETETPTPAEEIITEQPAVEKTSSADSGEGGSNLDDLSFLDDLGGGGSESVPSEPVEQPKTEEVQPEDTLGDLGGLEDEAQKTTAEIPEQEASKQEKEVPSAETVAPADETKSSLDDFTDEQITQIFTKIKTLRPALRKEVKNIILNDKLPESDMRTLLNYLLLNEDADIIQSFIERKTGVKITSPAGIQPGMPAVQKRMGPSIFSIIANNLFPLLRLLIPVAVFLYLLIAFLITPAIKSHKAKNLISQGVELILSQDVGLFKKAENNFKKALSIKPNYYDAYLKYGNAYFKIKRYNRAEKKYQELIEKNPEYIDAYFKLGKLYESENWPKKALKVYDKILKYEPDNIKALDRKAYVYYYILNDKQKAKKIYKDIIKNDPDNIYAHYGLLSLYIYDNDLDNVEKEHYQVLKYKNKYMDLKRLTELVRFYIDYKADSYAKRDELFLKAEDTIKKILDKDSRYSEALYEYARLQFKRKDINNAIQKIKLAIKYNEDVAKYHNFLGELYVERGNFSLAIDEFNTAIDIDDNFYQAHYNLGNINYYGLENYEKALEEYKKAAADEKNQRVDVYYNLGWLYYNMQNYIEADRWFTKAKVNSRIEEPKIRYSLGNVYLYSGKYNLAVSEYEEAVDYYRNKYGEYPKINKENMEEITDMENLSAVYNNLGVAYLKLKNEKKALLYFWKAVESAKKINYSNENASARINIQYVLNKNEVAREPSIFEDIPKTIVPEYEKKYKIF